jgi:hypothetical protein
MDAPVTLFAVALSAVTTMLFGLLPAWRLASGKTGHPLRAGRTETAGLGARRLQRTVVVAEVALAPLAGASRMLGSFLNLINVSIVRQPVRRLG